MKGEHPVADQQCPSCGAAAVRRCSNPDCDVTTISDSVPSKSVNIVECLRDAFARFADDIGPVSILLPEAADEIERLTRERDEAQERFEELRDVVYHAANVERDQLRSALTTLTEHYVEIIGPDAERDPEVIDARKCLAGETQSSIEPDNSKVICPACCHQFTAISVNDQVHRTQLRDRLRTELDVVLSKYTGLENVEARLRAALTEILEFDPHPTAKDVARKALGIEIPPLHVVGECVCPACGIRHGNATADGGF